MGEGGREGERVPLVVLTGHCHWQFNLMAKLGRGEGTWDEGELGSPGKHRTENGNVIFYNKHLELPG